ncbi:MAG: DNA repair protein RecO [Woeseiaceae bacterium]|nr:DNA repair protein RecO [Woeseiaceae bacterium]
MSRIEQEPAFLLHQRPFRDSSLLLDVLSREHGRLALVARGARGARSRLKGILRPFMPLRMSWVLKRDLGTLTGAELDGPPLRLTGDALMSGYYANELILNLQHRHDPQPEVFAAYREAVHALAAAENPAPTLRLFEIELLRLLGYALNFDHEALSDDELEPDAHYEYRAEQGPVRVQRTSGPMVFSGAELIGIRESRFDEAEILRSAGRLMRHVIHYHLGGKELKSRKVLIDLHRVNTEANTDKARGE